MSHLFTIIYGFWCATEIFFNTLFRSSAKDKKNTDKNSLSLIWISILVAIPLSVYVSMRYPSPISHSRLFAHIGLLLILIGIAFRFYAIRSLGEMFTVDVTIREHHQLKTDGVYTYIRHPSYTGSLISFLGYSLSLNNVYSLAIIMVVVTTVFLIRIHIEERALMESFGEQYLDYKLRTKALIPFIY